MAYVEGVQFEFCVETDMRTGFVTQEAPNPEVPQIAITLVRGEGGGYRWVGRQTYGYNAMTYSLEMERGADNTWYFARVCLNELAGCIPVRQVTPPP